MQRYEAHYYTAQQLQELLELIRDDPLYPLVKITAIYGLRRSELLGLQWDSIDFERGLLTIRHTVTKVSKTAEKDKTKNASSYRSFPLLDEAREIFLQAKKEERENRRLMGKGYQENARTVGPLRRTMGPTIFPHSCASIIFRISASTNCAIAAPVCCCPTASP